jgi:hypothetical protein
MWGLVQHPELVVRPAYGARLDALDDGSPRIMLVAADALACERAVPEVDLDRGAFGGEAALDPVRRRGWRRGPGLDLLSALLGLDPAARLVELLELDALKEPEQVETGRTIGHVFESSA